jgi:hypothetical protein
MPMVRGGFFGMDRGAQHEGCADDLCFHSQTKSSGWRGNPDRNHEWGWERRRNVFRSGDIVGGYRPQLPRDYVRLTTLMRARNLARRFCGSRCGTLGCRRANFSEMKVRLTAIEKLLREIE